MRVFISTVLGAACLLLLCAALAPVESAENEDVKAARECMDNFFTAFNAADNDALQKYMNYPHDFLSRNGQVRVTEERWDMSFERMRENEGWHSSSLDKVEISMVFDGKVHFNIVFSRHHEDGSTYRTVPGQWIVTRQDGHWGVQIRSY